MNSRRLMLPQGNDDTLSRNEGWFAAPQQNWAVDFC